MSLYKHINGKNNDRDYLEKKRKYITDPVKTDGGKLVGSSACFSEHGIDDWISVKKAYHKTDGKQGEHITISLTPDRKNVSNEEYLKVAEEVAENIFSGYNCIYAVHIDSTYRHIHLLFNSVSYVDGKRFHSSKSDLADKRLAVNRILEKHNFDIIRSSTDTMIDETPYDLENGFEVLEINDDKPYDDPFIDIIVDASDDEEFYDYLDGKASEDKKKNFHIEIVSKSKKIYPNSCDKYSYNAGQNSFNCYAENNDYSCHEKNDNKGDKVKMIDYKVFRNKENATETATAVNNTQVTPQNVPQPVQATQNNPVAFPTMMLNFSPKITINAKPSTTVQDIKTYLNAATPKTNSSNILKCAVGMASELDRRNIHMNIEANIFPDITINVMDNTDKNNHFNEDDVIDVESKEIW